MNKIYLLLVMLLATGCESLKGGDPQVTTTGKVPVPTLNAKTIVLTWTPATGTVQGYKIDASADGAQWFEGAVLLGQGMGVQIGGLTAGFKYYFRVRAFNQGGNSPYTQVVTVTP